MEVSNRIHRVISTLLKGEKCIRIVATQWLLPSKGVKHIVCGSSCWLRRGFRLFNVIVFQNELLSLDSNPNCKTNSGGHNLEVESSFIFGRDQWGFGQGNKCIAEGLFGIAALQSVSQSVSARLSEREGMVFIVAPQVTSWVGQKSPQSNGFSFFLFSFLDRLLPGNGRTRSPNPASHQDCLSGLPKAFASPFISVFEPVIGG